MSDKTADPTYQPPYDEDWGPMEVLMFGGVFAMVLVIVPIILAAAGEVLIAAYGAAAAWFILLGYESRLIPHCKYEVSKRV